MKHSGKILQHLPFKIHSGIMKTNFDDYNSDRMISDPANYKWSIFYFNKKDHRVIVPKYNKTMGWTFNFANFYSYMIISGIILSMLISIWLG